MRVEFLNEANIVHTLKGSYNSIKKFLPKADRVSGDIRDTINDFRENGVSPTYYVIGDDWVVFGSIHKLYQDFQVVVGPYIYIFHVTRNMSGKSYLGLTTSYTPYGHDTRRAPDTKESILIMQKKLNTIMRKASFAESYQDVRKIVENVAEMDWRN